MNYLLDTNIIIIYSRKNALSKKLEKKYRLFSGEHRLFISIVSLGEVDAIIKKLDIGLARQKSIKAILSSTYKIGINHSEVISKCGDIDAFSQGKYNMKHKFSSRNMGKNDLWIAATTNAFNLTLLTTDKDFQHLSSEYINIELVNLSDLD